MSIDMEQFHQVFFDESQEHIQEMEQLLMELDPDNADPEQLNCIFRAAHSIKGGSGIFGFDALTGITHVMENILDGARQQSLKMTIPIVDCLLSTVDILKDTLDSYREKQPVNQEAITDGIKKLENVLEQSGGKKALAIEQDEGFGLFEPVAKEGEDFGFFDTEEEPQVIPGDHLPQSVAKEGEDFGFFAPPEDESANTTNTNLVSGIAKEGEDFGFFEPVNNHSVTNAQVATQDKSKQAVAEAPAKRALKSTPTQSHNESSSIRVDTGKIDSLVNLVGELVITQSMLALIGENRESRDEAKLQSSIAELERHTREIQEAVMSMRMLPVSFVFNRFPRLVRDLSTKLGKKLELVIEGGNTEVDKGLIEKLVDPLTHLVRNSIDHGIEMPNVRIEKGKDATGEVILRAAQKGGSIVISIIDDGAGLNRERILNKAIEKGIDASDAMSDAEVWNLIFAPGFSTAEQITDVSGRGVGMDVVKRNIESIGGRVEIESIAGQGSEFNIRLPLTLAIVDGMCVGVGDQIYVVPLVNIIESIQPQPSQIKSLTKDKLLWVRDKYWPVIPLYDCMAIDNAQLDPADAIVVLIESSKKRFGLMVDRLLGQQQVVIKSLEQNYRRVSGVAGATIMGDGTVALILDVESLASSVDLNKIERLKHE
ncbi:chemotaxis protein CheA [Neptunicella marina]|uniref:Chemotaxis protein CheA n=1 Tax=Neptunicella marina TaxID=2125989 RepID=A0A8J6LYM4_9ALTE|nr:chemotaxis protein CheA [Neptunicella marina]MBC3765455.1 chemotaxis protein CheA [Neptunicella marina]